MFLPLLFISLLFFFVRVLPKQTKNEAKKPPTLRPPGPKGLPIIGNLHQFNTLATHLHFFRLSKTYGPLIFLQLGCVPALVVSSAKLAKEVLKTQDLNFCTRAPLKSHQKLSYNGLDITFAPYGELWREMKKTCVIHLFSFKRVQSFSLIRREEVTKMVNQICSLASSSKVVNLSELIVALSSSIICRVGFSKHYGDDQRSKCSRFRSILEEAQAMFMTKFFSDYLPCMGWLDQIRGTSRKLEKIYKELDGFYQELIDEHLEPKEKKLDREDIIDVLLQLRKEGSMPFELTLDHIKSVLMNVFVAGTDTSVATIVWAMTELIKNPNAMKKVQQEIRTSITKKLDITFIQEEDIQQLVYLKAVIKETLRLHPPAPMLVSHQALQECSIDGYKIEPGTLVYINAYAIGRDPKSWEDPESFMPERFLGNPIDYKGQDFELIPFGAGRRICPAILMGVATVEVALANLLCWFDWELPYGLKAEDVDMDVLPGITVQKKNALCLLASNKLGTTML